MATELAVGYISLVPSARGIHRQISQELGAPLARVANEAGANSSRAFSSRFQSGLRGATAGIAKTAGLAFGGIGVALGAAGAFGLKAAGDFQQTRIAFEGILGSGERAQTFLDGLRQFAAKTPFEFPELADAAKQLLAVGFNANDVIPVMTRLGNVAATLGVGGAEINGVVRALGQMKGKGKASAEELNQISEQIPGFSAIKAIAGDLGITTAQAFKQMESGAITADTAVNAILNGMEKFPGAAGAMGRQSKTLNGVLSTFKDTVRDALINGLEPILPTLSSGIASIAPAIGGAIGGASKALADFIPKFQTFSGVAIDAFSTGFGGRSTDAIEGWAKVLADAGVIVRGFSDFVSGPLAGALKPLGSAFADLGVAFGKFLVDAGPALKIVAILAGAALIASLKVLAVAVQLLADHMNVLGPALATAGAAFVGFKAVKAVESGILSIAKAAGTAVGTLQRWRGSLIRVGSALKSSITSIVQWGRATLLSAARAAKQVAVFVAQKVAALAAAAAQKVLTAAQWLLNAAMSANPITLVVAAIAALGAGVFLAYKKFKPFRDAVDKAWQILQSTFDWVKSHWPLLLGILTGPIGLAILAITRNFDKIRGLVTGAVDFVKTKWPVILAVLTGPFGLAALAVVRNFDKIKGLVTGAITFVQTKWSVILAILTGPFGLAVLFISRHFDSIVGFVTGLPARITGTFQRLWDPLTTGISTAKTWVGDRVGEIVGFFTGLPGKIATATAGMFDGIAAAFKSAINVVIAGWNSLDFKVPGFDPPGPGPKFGGFTIGLPHIAPLAQGGVIAHPTLALIGENARTAPEIVSPVKLMAETFRSVLKQTLSTTVVKTAAVSTSSSTTSASSLTSSSTAISANVEQSLSTTIGANAARALQAVRGYIAELAKIPTSVTSRIVADTRPAVSGFTNLVSAVSISAGPFEAVSTRMRDVSTETTIAKSRFTESAKSIGALLSTTSRSALSTTSADLLVQRRSLDTSTSAALVSLQRRRVDTRDQVSATRSTSVFESTVNTVTRAVSVLLPRIVALQQQVPAAGARVAGQATQGSTRVAQTTLNVVQATRSVRDLIVEVRKVLTTSATATSATSTSLTAGSTTRFESFVKTAVDRIRETAVHQAGGTTIAKTVSPAIRSESSVTTALLAPSVVSIATSFKGATSSVEKASTTFVNALDRVRETVVRVQQPGSPTLAKAASPVTRSESGGFDFRVARAPSVPIVSPTSRFTSNVKEGDLQRNADSRRIVGVEKQENHFHDRPALEELSVLNQKLGMRVAFAGRR